MKLKIEGLDKQAREWLMAHKNIMMSGAFIIIYEPCMHLCLDNTCAIYENRFNNCRLMQPNSNACREARLLENIQKRQDIAGKIKEMDIFKKLEAL